MINTTSKEAIIWLRRKNQARAKIWQLLYSMYKQKKDSIYWVKNICALLKMDPRVLNKHINFRIYPQEWKEQYILHLSEEDKKIIKKTIQIYEELKTKTSEEQKIAQYIFFHLIKNG